MKFYGNNVIVEKNIDIVLNLSGDIGLWLT